MKKTIFRISFCTLLLSASTAFAMQKQTALSSLSGPCSASIASKKTLSDRFKTPLEKCGNSCTECLFGPTTQECTEACGKGCLGFLPFSVCVAPNQVFEAGPEGLYTYLGGIALLACGCMSWSTLCSARQKKEQ